MATNFSIVGKLAACKSSEKFTPFEVKDYDTGWQSTKYKFCVISGGSRFFVEIGGGKWKDDKKNKILTFAKASDGNKSEKMEVSWDDRRNPEIIDKVAGYRVYTCNLLSFNEKKALEDSGDTETINKKEVRFIERTEYAQFVKKLIESEKYKDDLFKIQGTVEYSYSEKNDIYYRNLVVNKIYKVENETEMNAECTIDCFYTEDSLDTDMDDKAMFNCYTPFYFSSIKENRYVPVSLIINEPGSKKYEGFKKILTTFGDEEVRNVSIICDMIDGSEQSTITFDDLSDETKELIEMGLLDEKDAIAELGGNKFGPRISEWRVSKLGRKSSKGSEETAISISDLKKKPIAYQDLKESEDDIMNDLDDDIFDI